MGLIEEVRSRGGDIRLAELNETVRNIFEVLGFNHLCRVLGSEREGLESYHPIAGG
jgi:anti-sigma B factor antagonist